jgi:hypothetical protein
MPEEGPDPVERERLLSEIGIAPRESSSVTIPRAESSDAPRRSPTTVPAKPRAAAPPASDGRSRRRLAGGVMALAGAAWLGVALATGAPAPVALSGLLLVPGVLCWLGAERPPTPQKPLTPPREPPYTSPP